MSKRNKRNRDLNQQVAQFNEREQRNQPQHRNDAHLRLVQNNGMERARTKRVNITPRGFNQDALLGLLEDDNIDIVFAIGPAGTGKTLISTLAGIRALKDRNIDKFVITRPAVSVDEQHGFLPGTLQEKMAPWTRPIFDIFDEYFTPEQIEYMMRDNRLEIAPLAFMRGRTFHNSFIIADEMQNATISQMKMLLTRIGAGSKLVITGDLAQHDRGYEENGLKDFLSMLSASNRIKVVHFDKGDIERHPVVAEVLQIYGDD